MIGEGLDFSLSLLYCININYFFEVIMDKIDFQKAPKHHLDTWRRFTIVCVGTIISVGGLLGLMALFLT